MKKGLAIVIAGVIIVAAAAGAYVVGTKDDKPTTTTSETSSQAQVTESTTAATTETTTKSTTESTTESTTAALPAFVSKSYYYLFDDKNTTCIVFKFGKNGKVDLAYFDETNLIDEDPQYFKGYASYTFDGEKITVNKLPKAVKKSAITLEVKKDKLYCDGTQLESKDKISLVFAGEHFA